MCNYFKSLDDKCVFYIYPEYFGKEITDEMVMLFIKKKETKIFENLKKKDGTTFSASLAYIDGFIKPNFKNKVLDQPCPKCGGKIEALANGYACINFHNKKTEGSRVCNVYIPKAIAGRSITIIEAEMLLKEGKTHFLHAFKNNNNKIFSSRLFLNESGGVAFDSKLCKCPKCGGDMYIGEKAYNCSNFSNEKIKCEFSIWREISRRQISPEEAIILCENNITPILSGFSNDKGDFERKLTINDDFKIIMV